MAGGDKYCRILRIGVFFDGTDNNKKRDSKKHSESNIAKLSRLYRQGDFKDRLGRHIKGYMLYADGVGSYDSTWESNKHFIGRKYEKGTGAGAAKRIEKMIKDVLEILEKNPHGAKQGEFTKREIDLFGFSRGAAEARDFLNELIDKIIIRGPKKYKDVRFNFIGLYDTVASFGEPGNNINIRPVSNQVGKVDELHLPHGISLSDENFGARDIDIEGDTGRSFQAGSDEEMEAKMHELKKKGWKNITSTYVGGYRGHNAYSVHAERPSREFYRPFNFNISHAQAHRIVHIIADDELRKNFPLTDTYGAGAIEYNLIGVHSDQGAGYQPLEVEKFTLDGLYVNKMLARRAAEEEARKRNAQMGSRANLLTEYKAAEPRDEDLYQQFPTPHTESRYKPELLKNTPNNLSIVSLHLMYGEADRAFVPLEEPKEDIPDNLKAYYEYAKVTKENAYTYKVNKDGKSIKNAFSHHSGRDPLHTYDDKTTYVPLSDALLNDEPGSGNDLNYIQGKAKRVIYHNDAGQAVIPR